MTNVIGDASNQLNNSHLQCLTDDNHVDIYHELSDDKQFVYHPVGTIATVMPTKPDTLDPRTDDLLDIPTVWPLHYAPAERELYTIEANYKSALVGVEWPYVQLEPNTRYLMKITWIPDVRITDDGTPESLRVRCRLDVYGQDFTSDWHLLRDGQIGTTQETLFLIHNWQVSLANVHAEFWLVNGGIDKRVRIERVELIEVPNTFGTAYAEIGIPYNVPPGPSPNPDPDPPPDPSLSLPGWFGFALAIVIALIAGVIISAAIYNQSQAPQLTGAIAQETNLVEELINSLYAIPFFAPIAFSAPIVLYLTEALKRLKARFVPQDRVEWLTPRFIAVSLVMLFMGIYMIADQYAYSNALKDAAKIMTQLIEVFGKTLLTALGLHIVVATGHKRIRQLHLPGFDQ